jgi:hypothetical protein
MNYPINTKYNGFHCYKMAIMAVIAVAGLLLLMAVNVQAQTTNAYDVASDPAYSGDGPGNGLGSAAGSLNGGFGFGPWTFAIQNSGGAFINGSGPSGASFDLWNTSASSSTVAVRPFSSPLVAGQSFSFQYQLNSLDNGDTNAVLLQDASGNTLFEFWHTSGDNLNGHYGDASVVSGTATNFQYRYQQFSTYTFTLTSPTTYTFTDNTTGGAFSGTISGSIAQFTFLRANAGTAPGNGQDFQFDQLQVVSALPASFVSTTPSAGGYSGSISNAIVAQVLDGSIAINTNSVVFKLDGNIVIPTSVTKSVNITTISYVPSPALAWDSSHTAQVTVADGNGALYTNTWSFATAFQSLPSVLPGPIVASNQETGIIIFSTNDAWMGANYGATSGKTIYARFSMEFDNLNGETGGGGGYGGLQFILGGITGTQHVIAGNSWVSTNWSVDPYPTPQADLNPITPVVFGEWHTIVERVDYSPSANATVTVWLDPDFTQTEANQPTVPVIVSTVNTFDTIALRTGNGTTSATFSNIVMAATSASIGFAAPAAPQFLNLVPIQNDAAAALATPISAQVVFGTYGIGTNTVVLTLDGNNVTPTFAVAPNSITVNYQPPTPFVAGSGHNVTLSVTDSNGAPYSTSWTFTADPYPTLPITIAGPIDVVYGINGDSGLQLFTSENEWIGNNYQSSSTNTLYSQFSMEFFDLNGETGTGGGYGGLHFLASGGNVEHLITGNAWTSLNWGYDAEGGPGQNDFAPIVPINLNEYHTLVIKQVFNSGANDSVTIWLDPDLTKSEGSQTCSQSGTFLMDDTFDTVRLRCGNGSAAAEFSNIVMSATSPFAAGPGVLSLQASGGSANLSWTGAGTLQSAPAVTGPWADYGSQTNPQVLMTTNSAMFFRLR